MDRQDEPGVEGNARHEHDDRADDRGRILFTEFHEEVSSYKRLSSGSWEPPGARAVSYTANKKRRKALTAKARRMVISASLPRMHISGLGLQQTRFSLMRPLQSALLLFPLRDRGDVQYFVKFLIAKAITAGVGQCSNGRKIMCSSLDRSRQLLDDRHRVSGTRC